MTITSLLRNATHDTELLLAHVLKQSREYLLSHGEQRVSITRARRFQALKKRLHKGEPLAYILGTTPFAHLEFKVNKNVLIPRPETELLVERATEFLKNKTAYTVVDIGTGSGCIAITLATLQRDHHYHAIDISAKALAVARQNARMHGVNNIHFHQGDLLALCTVRKKLPPLLMLANLPYLPNADTKPHPSLGLRQLGPPGAPLLKGEGEKLSTRTYEPVLALDGGNDGLNLYKKLFVQLQSLKTPWTLIAEIDPRQEKTLHTILQQYFPTRTVSITNDWNNRARVLTIT